jgi:hypothetical protein
MSYRYSPKGFCLSEALQIREVTSQLHSRALALRPMATPHIQLLTVLPAKGQSRVGFMGGLH